MGMSYNIMPLETFAYVNYPTTNQGTYQLTNGNSADSLDQSTQLYLSAPTFNSTGGLSSFPIGTGLIGDNQRQSKNQSFYQLNSITGLHNNYQQSFASASRSSRPTPALAMPNQLMNLPGNNFLELQSANTVNQMGLASAGFNLIQVQPNFLVANNNLLLCLPPEGLTVQLSPQTVTQQALPQAVTTASLSMFNQQATITTQNQLNETSSQTILEKARQWHKDSNLANRAILCLKNLK